MGRDSEGGEPSRPDPECCMCGDQGLSSELFTCKYCRFRSQHKYCSNLYPRAESYHICNWCLNKKNENKGGNTKTSPYSSHKTINHRDANSIKMKEKKRVLVDNHEDRITTSGQIKKQAGPGPSMRRIRSEEISNGRDGMVIKHVFRNKVRRYKLLDEVSS